MSSLIESLNGLDGAVPELAVALANAQGEIEGARKGKKNDHFRSKYADLASVWDACREPLSKNGLSVIQLPIEAPTGFVGLATVLLHSSGQCLGDKFFMPVKDPTNPQAVGSALTYARRYALSALVGVCPEDDDGNSAASGPKPTAKVASNGPGQQGTKEYFQDAFAFAVGSKDIAEAKSVFTELRNSTVSEPAKTQLLTEFSNQIKQMQGNK